MVVSNRDRRFGIMIAAGALVLAAVPSYAADERGSVQGVVNDAAGHPVAGAFVRLKNADRRLTFMVISQEKGTFTANDLPSGKYTVQGVGGDYQSVLSTPVNVEANKAAKINVSLATKRGPMLAPSWPGRLPEAEVEKVPTDAAALPAGDGKALLSEKCTVCHDVQRIMSKRGDANDWAATIKIMRIQMAALSLPDITDAEAAQIVKYASTNFKPLPGGVDINARLPNALMTGKATKYRVVTYDLPRRYSEPHDIAVDPTGVAWAAERAGRLIRFDPKALEFTERPVPAGPATEDRQRLGNPQIDSKGMLWVVDGPNLRWLSYDTVNRQFHSYPWPKGHGAAGGNTMAIHPDGTIWATDVRKEVRMLNPSTAEFKFFEAPSAKATGKNPGAYGMAIAGDGSAWFAENDADMMGRADPKTGKVEELKIPYEGRSFPRRMNTDWDGNLWVGLWTPGKLMKIDYKTRQMTFFSPPSSNGGSYSVVADKKNKFIWLSQQQNDMIDRFDPKTGEWVEFPLPYAQSDPRRIEIDPTNPNRIFFSGNTADRIGFIEYMP